MSLDPPMDDVLIHEPSALTCPICGHFFGVDDVVVFRVDAAPDAFTIRLAPVHARCAPTPE